MSIFLAFFCGVYVHACVCVRVRVYVRVCVCVCMRVIPFADVIVPNTIYIKEKNAKGIEARDNYFPGIRLP